MFERFTRDARAVVVAAQEAARSTGDRRIRAVHLLIGLSDPDRPTADLLAERHLEPESLRQWVAEHHRGGLDASALSTLGIDLGAIRTTVESTFGRGALDEDPPAARRWPLRRHRRSDGRHVPFTDGARKSLELSLRETIRLGQGSIGAESVLLGVLRSDDREMLEAMAHFDVNLTALRRATEARLRRAA